jgi:integrase
MSVTVQPRKDPHGKIIPHKWMVRVLVTWDSGVQVRERKVVSRPTKAQARKYGEDIERRIIAGGEKTVLEGKAEADGSNITVTDWYALYHAAAERGEVGRKNQGKKQITVNDRRIRFRLWIEPTIGKLRMRDVTGADLRKIVNMLDDQIRTRMRFYEGEVEREERQGKMRKAGLSSKTASHIWSEITSGFREALSSKLDDLRVLSADITRAVQPPLKTDQREQEALFPSEVVQLLSCEAIPLSRRQCYAVGIYTGLRRSELERLTVEDVNLEHDTITVRGTKSNAARRQIPIEKPLRPLLVRLMKATKTGPLLDVPASTGHNGSSAIVKADLERADLERADLFRDDDVMMPFTFHGLRHTCITHWAVAGRDQLFLLTCAGHMDLKMTKRYLGKAASVSSKFGQPHPELPASVLGGAVVVKLDTKRTA